MKINPIFVAATCIALCSPQAAQADSIQPDTGFYRADAHITKAWPPALCQAMGQPAGWSKSGIFYYPGPSAEGAVLRFSTDTATQILAQRFSKTPVAGATGWKGTSTEDYEPGLLLQATTKFWAKITYLDSQSFTAAFSTLVGVTPSTKCSITENIVFIKTGS